MWKHNSCTYDVFLTVPVSSYGNACGPGSVGKIKLRMGYVIMTLSSARISERRARIIYIWTHLSAYKINFPFVQFPTFFPSFVCKRRRPYSLKTPPYFSFFFCFHIGRTLQLEQYIKSIKQSLSFYCVFLTTLHISPQFPAYNFVVLFFFSTSSS